MGIAEFFNDPMLTNLIDQALGSNRELLILNEEIQIAQNEILARQGAYLPFLTFSTGAGVSKPSKFTPEGVVEDQLQYRPGKFFPDPLPNINGSFNLAWQLDIWRELRNARDAAVLRYSGIIERRNFFVTRMVAEIAEHYYKLMALDKRLETLDQIIELQQRSLKTAQANKEAARGTELPVQRFQAEVSKNQSEKLIVRQEIVEVENKINVLVNRLPQPVERMTTGFFDLNIQKLNVGVPAQLLQNRPDIREAERELAAAGLDVKVARAHFFPRVDLTGGVGYEAFTPKFLFYTPASLIYNVAGNLVVPVINKKAIQAEYLSANAKQLESVYNYQRVVLNAFTEVVTRISMVENYRNSIEIKKQQLKSLEDSVESATKLFLNARVEYVEVLLAQRDLLEARTVLIETKQQQLSAIVNTYQALGGGDVFSQPPGAGHPPHNIAPPHAIPPAPAPGNKNNDPVEELPVPRRAG
jgi:NodT family efflux transporter outer membrane factor (OMF) lipoprotein